MSQILDKPMKKEFRFSETSEYLNIICGKNNFTEFGVLK